MPGLCGTSCTFLRRSGFSFFAMAGCEFTREYVSGKFPRQKVCGDCLNPSCWPVLRRLGVFERVRALPHGNLDAVEFIAIGGRKVHVDLPQGDESEIAIKRSFFDYLLMLRAKGLGVDVREATTISAIEKTASNNWKIEIDAEMIEARILIGADGRNSTIARL